MKKFALMNLNGDPIGSIEVIEEVVDTITEIEPGICLGYTIKTGEKKELLSFSLIWIPVEERTG